MKRHLVCLALLLVMFPLVVVANESPNIQLGQQLFESAQLGSNGQSCATCHAGSKGLEEISAYDDDTLKEMINFCIRDALRGSMLDPLSQELEAMLVYLRTLRPE